MIVDSVVDTRLQLFVFHAQIGKWKQGTLMEKLTLNLPSMYGDHHVVEVRRILLAMPGVADVNASSCFQVVEVEFDQKQLDADRIRAELEKAGYMGDSLAPMETGTAAYGTDNPDTFLRFTNAYAQTKKTISFAQEVRHVGRALWPCPGMGAVKVMSDNIRDGGDA